MDNIKKKDSNSQPILIKKKNRLDRVFRIFASYIEKKLMPLLPLVKTSG